MTGTESMRLDGRYRLIAPIAAGGMSVVWRGHDDVLARPIAVKLLAGVPTDGTDAQSVRREAMAVARISHPYIANVYDYGESPDPSGAIVPYIVMELVEGESLAQVLTRGPLSWPTAAGICAQVAAALAAAHQNGVVHRDVTPANIMLCVDGVKVVDFGISAAAGQVADEQVFGTPAYLAPERLSGGPAQPATDVYGLGLVLYQAIAGHLPWLSETTTQMLNAHRYVPPAPLPPVPGMPSHLAALCQRALAVDSTQRPSAAHLSGELAAIARAGDPRARPNLNGSVLNGTVLSAVPSATVPTVRSVTGTRILPHGATIFVDPTSSTVVSRPVGSAPPVDPGTRRSRERGMFVLPAVLLALLVGCLTWASLHQSAQIATPPPPHPSVTAPRLAAPAPTKAKAATPQTTPACHVDYEMLAQWVFGFTAQVTIINTGTADMADWTLRFTLQPGQRVGGGWNGEWDQNGAAVTVRDAGYNQAVPIGGQVTIGFLGTQAGNTRATPHRFTVNGVTCR